MRLSSWIVVMVSLTFVLSGFGLVGGHPSSAVSSNPASVIRAAGAGSREAHPLGHTRVASSAPPLYVGYWLAGSVIRPKAGTLDARAVSTFLKVPDASPTTDSFYSVLMSVWDNAGSYDQIGFTSYNGNWTLTVSTTTYCDAATLINYDLSSLSPGVTYEFVMFLTTSGYVTFDVYQGSTIVGGTVADTGASTFLVSEYYTCDSTQYYDFTDSEVVQESDQQAPDYAFHFVSTQENGANVAMIPFFEDSPGIVHVTTSTSATVIANEPFNLIYYGSSPDFIYLPEGVTSYSFTVQANELYGSDRIYACPYDNMPDLGVSSWSAFGEAPSFIHAVTLNIPSDAAPGNYVMNLYAYDGGFEECGTGNYTYLNLNIYIIG